MKGFKNWLNEVSTSTADVAHFSLPIKDSIFSYYKKIPDELQSVLFFKSYVDYLV